MKVLITGITGYLTQYLLKTVPENIHLSGTWHSPLTMDEKSDFKGIELFPLDLQNNLLPQLDNIKADILIHTAAEANLAKCENNPDYARRVNHLAVAELAAWCDQHKTRLIFVSTDIVFDGEHAPYKENDLPQPVNIYGKTKFAGEQAVQQFCADHAVLRLALVLGKGLGRKKNFIDWLKEQVKNQNEVPLFYDEIRTPIYAGDAAKFIWAVALSSHTGIFHCCGDKSIDRFTLGKKICDSLKKDYKFLKKVSVKNMSHPRPADVTLVDSKLKGLFSFRKTEIQSKMFFGSDAL